MSEPDWELCGECGYVGHTPPAVCCPNDPTCYWNGAITPCEECPAGAKWASENSFPETLFVIRERRARELADLGPVVASARHEEEA